MIGQYSVGEFISNCVYLIYTKIKFPKAKLIRLPLYLRGGKRRMRYGEGLTLGYSCRFDLAGDDISLVFGKNCKCNDRVHIVAHESVIIGDNVLMASNIFITDTSHGSYSSSPDQPSAAPDDRPLVTKHTKIGNNVWIGEGACIMPGVEIGDGCIIGANAVVTKSCAPNTIVAGVPACPIKRWDASSKTWKRCEA